MSSIALINPMKWKSAMKSGSFAGIPVIRAMLPFGPYIGGHIFWNMKSLS